MRFAEGKVKDYKRVGIERAYSCLGENENEVGI